MNAPLIFTWDGEAMVPLKRFAKVCDRCFVVGENYRLEEVQDRSMRSHNHYFACIHDAWMNLPDDVALDFPSPTILRKHALIMTGYRTERKLVLSSAAEARKVAKFLQPGDEDEYLIISIAGNVVVEWKAKSQSVKAMGGPTFQKSKTDVLEFLAAMIRVEQRTLESEAGRAA